jgi:RNA polymerase sigma-70 factor (ECF subfamily)
VSRARRALLAVLEAGGYDRDGAPAGDAMRSILADAERLSGSR